MPARNAHHCSYLEWGEYQVQMFYLHARPRQTAAGTVQVTTCRAPSAAWEGRKSDLLTCHVLQVHGHSRGKLLSAQGVVSVASSGGADAWLYGGVLVQPVAQGGPLLRGTTCIPVGTLLEPQEARRNGMRCEPKASKCSTLPPTNTSCLGEQLGLLFCLPWSSFSALLCLCLSKLQLTREIHTDGACVGCWSRGKALECLEAATHVLSTVPPSSEEAIEDPVSIAGRSSWMPAALGFESMVSGSSTACVPVAGASLGLAMAMLLCS
jgi:hypothetical protein